MGENDMPLYRPDLTRGDERAVLSCLERAPFRDDGLVRRWEAGWEGLWERHAVAFADHGEALAGLQRLLGWETGACIGGDPLIDPVWREALAANWLQWRPWDLAAGGERILPAQSERLRGVIVEHPCGLPAPLPPGEGRVVVLEEVSAVLRPLPGCGHGAVQLLNLAGPRMLVAGSGCLLLSRDRALIDALLREREHPPGGAACVLGLSQLAGLEGRLQRRRELAERYLATLRLRGLATLPANPAGGRGWERFVLTMTDREARGMLEGFLTRGGIGCGSPVWFKPGAAGGLPGVRGFLQRALALPLYAGLSDAGCKRIINRIHRWIERQ